MFVSSIQNITMTVLMNIMASLKYLEMLNIKQGLLVLMKRLRSIDFQFLRASEKIETNQLALHEMNRLLKTLLSILIVHTPTIKKKVKQIFSDGIPEKRLMKPNLGLKLWGQKFINVDINSDIDASDKNS